MNDLIRWKLVQLIPGPVCRWLWDADIHLGYWAPHIFGRVIGSKPTRVENLEEG